MEPFAEAVVSALSIYAAIGAGFALIFLTMGIHRIDPNARKSNLAFRLIILPGVVALWPLLLTRWARAAEPPVEQNAHRDQASDGGSL
jgi:hypothetical protein